MEQVDTWREVTWGDMLNIPDYTERRRMHGISESNFVSVLELMSSLDELL